MKITRELKTGIVAITVIALFIWGYNFMKGIHLFDGGIKTYYTEYSNVQGLNTASEVTINGVTVGKVMDISFNQDPKKKGQLMVEFSVETDFEFSKQSIAKIYSQNLMGGKSLAIVPSFEGEMAVPGDILKGEIESDIFSTVSEKLNPLQAKVENVIVSADSLMVGLTDLLNAETRASIKESVDHLNATLLNFKIVSDTLDNLVLRNEAKLSRTLSNAELMTENMTKLSDTLVNANLGETVKKLEDTLEKVNTILTNLEEGQGTIGKLLTDDEMYVNLTNASKELEELLEEIKMHPRRFVNISVFGKKDKGYVEKEEENPEPKKE